MTECVSLKLRQSGYCLLGPVKWATKVHKAEQPTCGNLFLRLESSFAAFLALECVEEIEEALLLQRQLQPILPTNRVKEAVATFCFQKMAKRLRCLNWVLHHEPNLPIKILNRVIIFLDEEA